MSFFILRNYYSVGEDNFAVMHLIEKQDYDAIKFIGDNYGKGKIVLADNLISTAIYPISQDYVVGILSSNLGDGNLTLADDFFMGDCGDKEEIINDYKVDLVLSRFEMNCDSLKEVYDKEGDYVYEAEK